MKNGDDKKSDSSDLHRRVEELRKNKTNATGLSVSEMELLKLILDFEAYQIKLELQNQELMKKLEEQEQTSLAILSILEDERSAEEALKESREIYRTFIDSSDDRIFLKDDQFKNIMVNERNAAYLGKKPEDVIGKTDFELLPYETALKCRESDQLALTDNSIIISEEEQNGRFYEIRKFPVKFKNEKTGIGGYIRDITEMKILANAMKNSASMWRTTFDSISDIIWLLDDDFKIIRANIASEKLLGISPADLTGKHCWEVVHGTSTTIERCPYMELKGSQIQKSAVMFINNRWLDIKVYPVLDENKKLTGAVHILHDITEQKQIEDSLLLRSTAMENAANGIIITDPKGIILWSNSAFELLSGYSFDEAIGRNPREIVKSGKQNREFYKQMWDTIRTGSIWKGELVNKRKDGDLYTEEMTIAPVKDKTGEIMNYIAIKQDITERNLAIKILKDSLDEKRELIREIYHRTKNNMQVIISIFSIQSMMNDNEIVSKVLMDMENRIRTMALVHEKLYQSRDLSKLDLKDYLLELINNIITGYVSDSEKIVINEQMESLEVLIDTATTCGLVVNELVTNAAKYAFKGKDIFELMISLRMDKDGEITLIVADNGCGAGMNIDLYNTKSMGLQIVRNIVEYQMKGEINLDNSEGIKWTIKFKDNLYKERV